MKKLLLSAAVLMAFAAGIVLTQIACSKSVAQNNGDTAPAIKQLNKVIYSKDVTGANKYEIWVVNYDGTGSQKINIPTTYALVGDDGAFGLSPDGQKVFFTTTLPNDVSEIYSCNLDGTGIVKIASSSGANIRFGAAY